MTFLVSVAGSRMAHRIQSKTVIALQGPTAFRRALDWGPECRLSILRNGNVPCRYFWNVPVDLKKSPVTYYENSLSILR